MCIRSIFIPSVSSSFLVHTHNMILPTRLLTITLFVALLSIALAQPVPPGGYKGAALKGCREGCKDAAYACLDLCSELCKSVVGCLGVPACRLSCTYGESTCANECILGTPKIPPGR